MDGYAYDTALLILRVCLGLTMAAHGYNKFFGGGRIPGTARWFESIGMKPGTLHARIAATTEMSAGLGLAVGGQALHGAPIDLPYPGIPALFAHVAILYLRLATTWAE